MPELAASVRFGSIFAGPAAWLQAQDVDVTVVTRADALSNQLRLAVRDLRYLDVLPQLAPALLGWQTKSDWVHTNRFNSSPTMRSAFSCAPQGQASGLL